MPNIRLPDGSVKSFPGPVTVAEGRAGDRSGAARAALAGKLNGKLVDTSHRVEAMRSSPLSPNATGRGRDPAALHCAPAAYAVRTCFPEAQVTIGPVVETGFYYDFSFKRPFRQTISNAIEKRMRKLAKKDLPVPREVWPRARRFNTSNPSASTTRPRSSPRYPRTKRSRCTGRGFIDLCRGPHVPSTGKLKVFKLMKVAGAYWRGDSKN